MGALWSIILAAGESKRMGSPKMLLPFKETTIIESVITNVLSSETDNILVVLGAYYDAVKARIINMPVKHCYNEYYKQGMLSSVKCGLRNLPLGIEAVLIFQGDQPMIGPEAINSVIKGFRSSHKGIVIPVHNERRGHPLLVDKKYRDEIEKLDSNDGLRSLSSLFSEDVLEIAIDDPGILRDIDTQDEYIKEINLIK
jgi:molybdenum cofactor cytidylyltransferase